MMKKGVENYFKGPVVNSSDYDIILKNNIIMGRVEPIKLLKYLAEPLTLAYPGLITLLYFIQM